MISQTKVTLVLPITNFEYGKKTYQSIQKQDMSDVKLVLVVDKKEQQLSSDLKDFIKENPIGQAELLEIDFLESIMQVKEKLEGLVFFLKESMRYRKDVLLKVKEALAEGMFVQAEEKRPTILIPVAVDKKNPVSMEYEEFCKNKSKCIDLDQDYMLIHRMYFAHGLWADEICWESEKLALANDDIELSIIRLVTANVCYAGKIHIVRGVTVWIEGFRDMEKIVTRYIETYEGIEEITKQFFVPLKHAYDVLKLDKNRNGIYLLLYYCNRFLSAMTQLEKKNQHRPQGLENTYVDAIKELTSFEVLAAHPYVTTGFKYAMVKKYFPQISSGQDLFADKILGPEWRYISLFEMRPREDGRLYLEFTFMKMLVEDYDLYCVVNGEQYLCEKGAFVRENSFLDELLGTTDVYSVTVPRGESMDIIFARKQKEQLIPCRIIMFQKAVPLSNRVFLYKKLKGQIYFTDDDCKTIFVRQPNPVRYLKLSTKRLKSMLSYGNAGIKAIIARTLYHLANFFDRREVWLITDRSNRADDNGEVMFRYLCEHKDPKRNVYFVIDADADDNRRMQQFGKTVAPFSWKHKLLFLRSVVTMSSQANKMVYDPFGILDHLYRDIMFEKRLVFLQHGVTKDNQSKWLNKYNRNLYGFVVNTRAEYDSVFAYDYYYTPSRVWLTGMPRFDKLYHDEQKYITIMPTWRKSLSKGTDENGVWLLDDDFKKSQYFIFYNQLLNDERLLKEAEKLGYTICFMPHPNTITGLKYFKKHKNVQFFDMTKSYREVFAQTDLMVTDYSSVAFDFAYLRKPIIYSQFDRAEFFNGAHSYTEGYFDYDRDGFGMVTTDLDATVDAIITAMREGCQLDETYRKRIDATFAFDDRNCCKRVLERYLVERRNEE